MTNQVAPVKTSFEYQGRTFTAYWNGKEYGTKCYVTTTSDRGSQTKVTFDLKSGSVETGTSMLDFGRAALNSLDVVPFNGFDFSPR